MDWPLALIVTFTRSSFPAALAGTTNERRALPARNDSACVSTRPATDGSQIIVPRSRDAPVSLRVTLNDTVKRFPATGFMGAVTGAPITGLSRLRSQPRPR